MDNRKTHNRYLVIVADRMQGRFFTIFLGDFENMGKFVKNNVWEKTKTNNGRQGKVDRHIRDHFYKHLKHIGKEADNFIKTDFLGINGVIVGGHKDELSDIKKSLPGHLKKIIVGEFIAKPDISLGELTEKAKSVL